MKSRRRGNAALDRHSTLAETCLVEHSLEFDPVNQWAVIRYHGEVRIEDSLDMMRRLVALPGWSPHCDRIVVYDDGLLGDVSAADFRRIRQSLVDFVAEHYGDTPNYSAQVCANAMQRPLVEYWVSFGRGAYGPALEIFDTVAAAKAWLLRQRRRDAAD